MSKKILAMLLVVAMVCTLFVTPVLADEAGIVAISDDSAAAFPDTVGNWAESSINRWGAANVVNGDHAGNFNPDNTITRAELAQLLVNLLGLTEKAEAGTFTDVAAGDWFEDAVLKCAAAGIMKGDGTGLANPNSPITRQEAIVMIGRALGLKPAASADLGSFQDGETVADWAASYMAPLAAMGILSGVADANGDLNILPLLNIDRASTAALLDKAIGQYVVNGGTVKADNANKFVVVKAAEGEDVVVTGETAGVTVAAGNAADVKLDEVITDSVKVDAPVKVTVDQDSKVDTLTLNADAKIQNNGTVNTVANNAEKATFDGKAPAKIENAEGVPALKDSNGKEVNKTGVIVVPSGGGSSSSGGGTVTPRPVENAKIVFITEDNYETLAPTYNYYGATEETLRPAADVQLPWLLVEYARNATGTVEFTVTKDGAAVQFGTVAEGETDPTLTDALTFEAATTNKNAWVSFHMVSQAETDHKGQTWLNQADAKGEYEVAVKLNGTTAKSDAKTYPEGEEPSGKHTLWLVGDSTVAAFNDYYYYPRYGYGTQIGNYLDDTYEVKNLALSGRSTKSFVTDPSGNYQTLIDGMKEGDALIIGFGHNDQKADERYTNPNGTWETEGSFANTLWVNYVKPAQDAKAEVILCTPIVRRTTQTTGFKDSEIHITADQTDSTGKTYPGGDYPAAIKALGEAKSVPVVDLTTMTKELYTTLTTAETMYLHAWTKDKDSTVDNTHLNIYGAKKVAYMLADALSKGDTELGKHVDLTAGEPTKENDLKSLEGWTEPPYAPPTTTSDTWGDYTYGTGESAITFKAGVFGVWGGAENMTTENCVMGADADGNLSMVAKNNKSKIAGSQDGIAMYYVQVPVGKTVEMTATAKVASIGNQQAGFGLMARDDMYIDYFDPAITSAYVVAGSLGIGSGRNGTNCFARNAAGSQVDASASNTLPVGVMADADGKLIANATYALKLKGDATNGFTCNFGDQEAKTYDIPLIQKDTEYYYVGLFVSRAADVTFSDITLTIADPVEEPEPAASEATFTAMTEALYDVAFPAATWVGRPAFAGVAPTFGTATTAADGTVTIPVTGNVPYTTDFTGFHPLASEQEGNYVSFYVPVPAEAVGNCTVVAKNGSVSADGSTTTDKSFNMSAEALDPLADGKVLALIVRLNNKADKKATYTIDWDGEGDAYAATTYVLDFSGATLESKPVPASALTADDVAAMTDAQLDGFTWENCPANVADMQENVTLAVEGTTVKVTGTLKYVTGFTGFNASDATEQEGHYFALHLERPSTISGTSTVVLTSKGVDKAPIELTDADATLDVIFHVASAASKPTLKIDWDGEGTAYAETTYVLDFSGATLEAAPTQP